MNPVTPLPLHISLGEGAEALRQTGADAPAHAGEPADAFADALEDALEATNQIQLDADATVERFARGDEMPVHEVMLALTEADASMRLATAVTTRAIAAYQEIARLQV